jgi:hypothetical protein
LWHDRVRWYWSNIKQGSLTFGTTNQHTESAFG